jgi:hypothetical protein
VDRPLNRLAIYLVKEDETCLVGVVELPFSASSPLPLADRYPSSLSARSTTGLEDFTARGRRIRSCWEFTFPFIWISAEDDMARRLYGRGNDRD